MARSVENPCAIHNCRSSDGCAPATWRSPVGAGRFCPMRSPVQRHALVAKLLHRPLVLGKVRQSHAAQDVWRLGELNIVITDDLDAIAPRIEEIEKRPGQRVHARVRQGATDGLLIIDHESKMTAIVRGLPAPLLESQELITQIDEGRGLAPAAQLEIEQ